MTNLSALMWPYEKLGEALDAVAVECGFTNTVRQAPVPPAYHEPEADNVTRWLEAAAPLLGMEAEPVDCFYNELDQFLVGVGPALLRLSFNNHSAYLAILGRRGRRLAVLSPERRVAHIPLAEIRAALCHDLEAPHLAT